MLRRIVHTILNIDTANSYVPYQELESRQLLCGLLDKPDSFFDHIHRYANSVTTQLVFGWRAPTADDPRVKQLFDNIAKLSAIGSSPAAAILDMFPALRSLPDFLLPLRKYGKAMHEAEKRIYVGHYTDSKRAIEKRESLVRCFFFLPRWTICSWLSSSLTDK